VVIGKHADSTCDIRAQEADIERRELIEVINKKRSKTKTKEVMDGLISKKKEYVDQKRKSKKDKKEKSKFTSLKENIKDFKEELKKKRKERLMMEEGFNNELDHILKRKANIYQEAYHVGDLHVVC